MDLNHYPPKQEVYIEHNCSYETAENDKIVPYHFHDSNEIFLLIEGHVNYYIERSYFKLQPDDLLIINTHEMHRRVITSEGNYDRLFINISDSCLKRLSTRNTDLSYCFTSHAIGQKNLIHLSSSDRIYFLKLAEQLKASLCSTEYGNELEGSINLAALLLFTNRRYLNGDFCSPNLMPELIQNVIQYIEAHLTSPITLDELSKNFFLSGSYISRQFKKHTGLTLRSYILSRRILLAKDLLSEGYSVADTCFLSGFQDYSNFIRSFTLAVGISPGKFKLHQ